MNKYYLIESGPLLDAVKECIEMKAKTREATIRFCERIGVEKYRAGFRGTPISFIFPGRVIKGFTQRDRHGNSHPKKDGPYYEEWRNIPEHQNSTSVIQSITGIPLFYSYTTTIGNGSSAIGDIFPCGFLYLSAEGPYVMYVPDIAKYFEEFKEQTPDAVIKDDADKWQINVEGITEISQAHWELMVAQHKVEQEEKDRAEEARDKN